VKFTGQKKPRHTGLRFAGFLLFLTQLLDALELLLSIQAFLSLSSGFHYILEDPKQGASS
jgi:hypothetical protein